MPGLARAARMHKEVAVRWGGRHASVLIGAELVLIVRQEHENRLQQQTCVPQALAAAAAATVWHGLHAQLRAS